MKRILLLKMTFLNQIYIADHLATEGNLDFETTTGSEYGEVSSAERPKLVRYREVGSA